MRINIYRGQVDGTLFTIMILIPPLNRHQTANKVPDTTDKMPDSSNEEPDNEHYISENGSITTAEMVELLDVKHLFR